MSEDAGNEMHEDQRIDEAAGPKLMDRRGMLTAAAAAAAGLIGTMVMPAAAMATTGDAVTAGNVATGTTTDPGLWGTSPAGVGVLGESTGYDGIQGHSAGVGYSGVWGRSTASGGAGVTGDGPAYGVNGRTEAGTGVAGAATTGTGVSAQSTSGDALSVVGKASFSRSGKVSVARRKSSIVVSVPSGVATSAMILVTLQGDPGSGVYVKFAKRWSATSIKIYFNKKSTRASSIVWMILD